MLDCEIQWLGGVIDAEGSFILTCAKAKRGLYLCKIRKASLIIATTDNVIIPTICQLLNCSCGTYIYNKQKRSAIHQVRIGGSSLRLLLPVLIPHLYTKQPQAKLVLSALNIKSGINAFYSKDESQLWQSYYDRVRILNQVGKTAAKDTEQRNHVFSWPWLAGMTDGDGAIINSKFGIGGRLLKPVFKISLAHMLTIKYLEEQLGTNSLKGGGGIGNRRPIKTIRLMAKKQLEILPSITPHLRLKKPQAQIALEIATLRQLLPIGTNNSNSDIGVRIKRLLNRLDELNASSNKSRRKRRPIVV